MNYQNDKTIPSPFPSEMAREEASPRNIQAGSFAKDEKVRVGTKSNDGQHQSKASGRERSVGSYQAKQVVSPSVEDVVWSFLGKGKDDAAEYKARIEEMLSSSLYQYAASTLEGIYTFIEENNYITEKQKEAVNNIDNNPSYSDPFF